MGGTRDHHAKLNKPDSDKCHMFSLICRTKVFKIHANRKGTIWEQEENHQEGEGEQDKAMGMKMIKVHYIHL
jgi:hypothetical protein